MKLEGLAAVKWASMKHAYGSAEDVPEAIRALAAAKGEAQDDALEQLASTIFHQGDVYASTLAAWPFLVDVACSESLDDERRGILLLNLGTTYYFATLEDLSEGGEADDADDEESVSLVKPAEVQKVVAPSFDRLMGLFTKAEEKTRLALVNLCVQNPALAARHEAILREGEKGEEPLRLLSTLALAILGKDDAKTEATLEQLFVAVPGSGDRADDEDAPLHAVASMAAEDAVIALLTEG